MSLFFRFDAPHYSIWIPRAASLFLLFILSRCGVSGGGAQPAVLPSESQSPGVSVAGDAEAEKDEKLAGVPMAPNEENLVKYGKLIEELSSGNKRLKKELEHSALMLPTNLPDRANEALLKSRAERYLLSNQEFDTAKEHIEAAFEFEKESLLDVAQAHFEKAVALDPKSSEAYAGMGRCQFKLNRGEAAIASLKEAIRLAPTRPGWHLSLGDVYYAMGDLDSAMTVYEQAARLSPDLATVHESIAKVYWAKGNYSQAKKAIDQCISLKGSPDPEFVKRLNQDIEKGGA